MIKKWPGWLNVLALWPIYCVAGGAFYYLLKWCFGAVTFKGLIIMLSLFQCALYLAKWRFYDGGLHFK